MKNTLKVTIEIVDWRDTPINALTRQTKLDILADTITNYVGRREDDLDIVTKISLEYE